LWYVYFLELSNGDIYVGSTDDLRRRFASHQQGHVVSTSKYLPAVLRSYVAVADEATARRLERYFNQVLAKPLPRSASCRRANDERFVRQICCAISTNNERQVCPETSVTDRT